MEAMQRPTAKHEVKLGNPKEKEKEVGARGVKNTTGRLIQSTNLGHRGS